MACEGFASVRIFSIVFRRPSDLCIFEKDDLVFMINLAENSVILLNIWKENKVANILYFVLH